MSTPQSGGRAAGSLCGGELPERTNGAASKAVVASGSPWVQIPYSPPTQHQEIPGDLCLCEIMLKKMLLLG